MDNARVKRLAAEWLPKRFNGWKLTAFINAGKTALVFRADKGGNTAAVKVFDPETVERYGRQEVEERLKRELTLVGKHHDNLVQICDGGYAKDDDLYFIVMELVDGPALSTALKSVPMEAVKPIISQIAAAARFLEDQDLVHRDIKPDNISVHPDFKRAVLLDLGVIRPFRREDEPPLTDREEQVFIGTLQYAPPEFLLRNEKHTIEGFRAVTFYQLGAVLYDLLMRQRIFHDSSSPFARLVQAILHDAPKIDPTGKPPDVVTLANNCLVKNPDLRLQIVRWTDFDFTKAVGELGTAARERIRLRRMRAIFESSEIEPSEGYKEQLKRQQILGELLSRLSEQVRTICTESDLPPRLVTPFLDESGRESVLSIFFKASALFGLPTDCHAALRLELLDSGAQVVLLEYACAVSKSQVHVSDFAGRWSHILSGVYEDSVVRSAVEAALFPTFEIAMDTADPSGTTWISTPSATENK